LDFRLSHGDAAKNFVQQLDKFLLKATRTQYSPVCTTINTPVKTARNNLLSQLRLNPELITGLDKIRPHFRQQYIQEAFEIAHIDRKIAWNKGGGNNEEAWSSKRMWACKRIYQADTSDGQLSKV